MRNKKGFTLAEVMITLALLGVVAAVTIPTISQNSRGIQNRSLFKTGLSVLNEAGSMSYAKYGIDFASAKDACDYAVSGEDVNSSDSARVSHRSICGIFTRTLSASPVASQLNNNSQTYTISTKILGSSESDLVFYTLSNGMLLGINPTNKTHAPCKLRKNQTLNANWISDHKHCIGFLDVNGLTRPNAEVSCDQGATNYDIEHPCRVDNKKITDVFPVIFYNSNVDPATNAAAYVLDTAR